MARPDRAEEGSWLDQIEQKRAILEDLDSKIANTIEEEDELTGEICEVEEYKSFC